MKDEDTIMSTYGWCYKKSQSLVEFILWGLCMSVQNNMAVCSVVAVICQLDQSMWVEWCSENFRSSFTELFISPAPLLKAAPGRSAHYCFALHSDFSLLHSNCIQNNRAAETAYSNIFQIEMTYFKLRSDASRVGLIVSVIQKQN